ncbi:hypothetical protein Tco_0467851 [Tanacetum coccineum]
MYPVSVQRCTDNLEGVNPNWAPYWYSRDSHLLLEAFSDVIDDGLSHGRKSTTETSDPIPNVPVRLSKGSGDDRVEKGYHVMTASLDANTGEKFSARLLLSEQLYNGEQKNLTATVDGKDKEFTITKGISSVRRSFLIRDGRWEQTPLFPSILAIQEEVGEGSGHPSKPQPPPSTAQPIHEEPIPNVGLSSHKRTYT